MTQKQPINQITEGVIWKQLLLFFFPILLGWYYVKKKYKLNVNFFHNILYVIQPVFLIHLNFFDTDSHIHPVKDIHNDYEFLPYYKKFLYIGIPAGRHDYN